MPVLQPVKSEITICEKRQTFVNNNKCSLVLGGPGSGKTTIALIKANHEMLNQHILRYQKILFLSFARSTVSRVIETSRTHLDAGNRKQLEINTYHGFTWSILQSHGYLLGLSRTIKLISPPDAAAHLADIRSQRISIEERKSLEKIETERLAYSEGILSFDLFASLTAKILKDNPKLTQIICDRYPLIALDEFQDTNADEWELIKELGKYSRLIALGDPDQRIYEFRGADPARIRQFVDQFSPDIFDFGNENNRSPGTDIALYGNDILTGTNKTKTYNNVVVKKWKYLYQSSTYILKTNVLEACRRLNTNNKSWSLAILVPTKRLMLSVSDSLSSANNNLVSINHNVSIDPEGPTLAARIIVFLLEPILDHDSSLKELINSICLFYKGRGGGNPTQTDLNQSKSLIAALEKAITKGSIANNSIIKGCDDFLKKLAVLKYSGDPQVDWLAIRKMLNESGCKRLAQVAEEAFYIRLLRKGSTLRESLSAAWRRNGSYTGARLIVEMAFVQEHFIASTTVTQGITVMNMHKAKGKEFDEVILYEDQHQGRFFSAYGNIDQARLNLRVSVTRAKQRTTILTPQAEPSSLLF